MGKMQISSMLKLVIYVYIPLCFTASEQHYKTTTWLQRRANVERMEDNRLPKTATHYRLRG
jgi:hypothetical protein